MPYPNYFPQKYRTKPKPKPKHPNIEFVILCIILGFLSAFAITLSQH